MIYRVLFDLVLRRMDAETVHTVTIRLLRILGRLPGALGLVRRIAGKRDPALALEALGLRFPSPVGLAAGFDKDAEVHEAIAAFGFGFVEVGTLTAHAQPGNPRPRLFRLPADRAVINRMGFNNHGSAAAAPRIDRPRTHLLGANIGKSKVTSADDAAQDYATSAALLAPGCDYLVVNVSSPNTPGLRDLQATASLRPILSAVLDAATIDGQRPPVLVKIAPDLADEDVDAIADLAVELGLAGIIATNTTVRRDGLRSDPTEVAAAGQGGLSGAPLRDRSVALLRRLRARVGDDLVLVSVGGIETADDVWERLAAGASLVQVYTALIYAGPGFARRINHDLSARLQREGCGSIAEVVGSAVR